MEVKYSKKDDPDSYNEDTTKAIFLGNTKCVEEYEKIHMIGEGTYGTVYKARNKKTGQLYALKKVKMEHETDGFPVTSLREIKYLQRLKHPNIVNLKEVSVGYKHNNVFLVFDYYDTDLANLVDGLISKNEFLTLSDIKTIQLW